MDPKYTGKITTGLSPPDIYLFFTYYCWCNGKSAAHYKIYQRISGLWITLKKQDDRKRMDRNSTRWGKGQETEMGSEKQKGKDIQRSDYLNQKNLHWLE